MRRLLVLILLMLACTAALAEGFDQAALEQLEGCSVYREANQVDTVVRPMSQPYAGQVSLEDADLAVFLDFIRLENQEVTLLRLTLSLSSCEYLAAGEMAITVAGKEYAFQVRPQVAEYDLTYYEDYAACLTDESLPMLKAMAGSRQDTFPIRLTGNLTVEGSITLPLDEVAALYDTYVDLGGPSQRLDCCREDWPVTISTTKK